jgi:REP element-mobilizing transposase RayT
MPKRPRNLAPDRLHHVTSRGNDRRAIVLDDIDRVAMLRDLAATVARFGWTCCAYALLVNHVHLVLRPNAPTLADGMAWFKSRYARRFNRRYDGTDHVFGQPYFNKVVETTEQFETLAVYVAANAAVAGACERAEDWQWSSYAATLGLAPMPTFVDAEPPLEIFGPDVAAARRRYKSAVDEAVEAALAEPRLGAWYRDVAEGYASVIEPPLGWRSRYRRASRSPIAASPPAAANSATTAITSQSAQLAPGRPPIASATRSR